MTVVQRYNPDERARAKAISRARDEELVESGAVSRAEIQRVNGGGIGKVIRKARIRRRRVALG